MRHPVRTLLLLWRHLLNTAGLGAGPRCVCCGVQDRPERSVHLDLLMSGIGMAWLCESCLAFPEG